VLLEKAFKQGKIAMDVVLIFFGIGIWLFFWGFMRLRRKRKIEDIPTSTVRGLAMGLVELVGTAKKKNAVISPLTKTECTFYRYTVERYQHSRRSGHWVVIARGDSYATPLWLDDGTGKALIFSQGAELIMPVSFEFTTGLGENLPANLEEFLRNNNIRYGTFFSGSKMRFREWHIFEGEKIYVMGTASASSVEVDLMETHKKKLIFRLEALKQDSEKMAGVDIDKDGKISAEEWDAAVKKTEQALLEEELKAAPLQGQLDAVISRGNSKEVFIISNYSQKSLIENLTWQAIFGVFGGAALSILMLGCLLSRFRYKWF